jgi:LmbE family N-acetylglucosaminyl deacetylase
MIILAIFAHPDDSEFHAGGSLARWASEGHTVHAICCTDGGLGTKRRDLLREEVVASRKKEITLAMQALCVITARPCASG